MTKLDSILKSRDITLLTMVHIVKSILSHVWMSVGIKKAEHWRIDAFELWCWRRPLRFPQTARRDKSILKEINPEYSLEGLMLKLKLQYFGHLMWRTDSSEKTLMRQVLGPGALGRTRGIGWRGSWEGGLGWGTHVNPWLIHVNVWQNPLQYCKVISLQLIKKKKKKKKRPWSWKR